MKKRIKITPQLIEKLVSCGFTEKSIRESLQLSKKDYSDLLTNKEFASAVKKGKESADTNIEESLFKKAIGFEKEKTVFTKYRGKITSFNYTKQYVPSISAIKFWLKNKRPDEWNDTNGNKKSSNKLAPEYLDKLKKFAAERMKEMM